MSMRRGWLGAPKPPKNPHSLEHLKYLHHILTKNSTVTEGNKALIVEALRSMSEILIWGDQNDSSVFEFYLEKNMFLFFLNILKQNAGNYVCIQLLQTLNILFENLQNDTSLYYLLSNNHVNEVICHKFDFSDEEVLAYYISFLKTLSLKLNQHTIHFFYNEHTDDFALYTEAIKFFNHSESMVRIAVRTLTLNVYKVQDEAMLRYIRDRTAVPYFSNLVWFIGNHVRELNTCIRSNDNHQNLNRLSDLVAEHLDHLHYLNDILAIENEQLNNILGKQLLHHLFVPLYIYSLSSIGDDDSDEQEQPRVNSVLALFLLSQVFLIIQYEPVVHKLAEVIFNQNSTLNLMNDQDEVYEAFVQQPESLDTWLDSKRVKKATKKKTKRPNFRNVGSDDEPTSPVEPPEPVIEQNYTVEEVERSLNTQQEVLAPVSPTYSDDDISSSNSNESPGRVLSLPQPQNITDEQKAAATRLSSSSSGISTNRPFLDTIYSALNCQGDDYKALLALCLLYAMLHNKVCGILFSTCSHGELAAGISSDLTEVVQLGQSKDDENNDTYSHWLVERLLRILSTSVKKDSKVRLATIGLSCLLLKEIGLKNDKCILLESHLTCIEDSRNESMNNLHPFYKEEEMFLDILEDEYRTFQSKPLNVEYLMMDSSLLLPPTGTPLTGIEFKSRLPCGPAEQAKRAIGTFIGLRDLSLCLCKEVETQLPLTREQDCIQTNDKLDLNNSDLIACTVSNRDGKQRRFLVVDLYQLVLVEPESKRLGWGVVRFAGFLQDVEVASDNEDSRVLRVTIHKPSGARRVPLLSADFIFDDHIRCMAAKQRLTKGRMRARNLKMQRIAVLLGLPENTIEDPFANSYMLNTSFHAPRSQFRAYADPHALESSPHQRGNSSHTPQPILKRPGGSMAITPGRIGNLGLPVSPRAGSARNQSPALGRHREKVSSSLTTCESAPELISAKELTLVLQDHSIDGAAIQHSEPPSFVSNVIPRGAPKSHRRTNSAHISSSELPYEEVGVHVGNLDLESKSGESTSPSFGADASPLEEGVDASSLNEFSIEEDANASNLASNSEVGEKEQISDVVPNDSIPPTSDPESIPSQIENSNYDITHLETDDLKVARLRSESSTSNKDIALTLQPPSSAPVSLMNQEEPKFSVSLSPVKSVSSDFKSDNQ
ncbi:protein CLEC16A-like isoform X1 [Styela clava]